jgi:aspartate aminotransferase
MYAFPFGHQGKAVLIFRFADPDAAIAVLQAKGESGADRRRAPQGLMPVARTIAQQLERASWIRRMFEEGARLKQERGEANIFDFTSATPRWSRPCDPGGPAPGREGAELPGRHGYMPNPGFPEVRAAMAERLRRDSGLDFKAEHICMTTGAAAACNVI